MQRIFIAAAVSAGCLSTPAKPAPCVQDPDLVTYFSFDEGAGAFAYDQSAFAIKPAIAGDGTQWVIGKQGTAIQVDGARGALVEFFANPGLSFHGGRGSFSLSYWIRPTALTGPEAARPFEIAHCAGGAYIYTAVRERGLVEFGGFDSAGNFAIQGSAIDVVRANDWTHVVHVLDRQLQFATTYVNGRLSGPVASLEPWTGIIDCSGATENLTFGGFSPFQYSGAIDEFALYSRALTAEDINGLFSLKRPNCLLTNSGPSE